MKKMRGVLSWVLILVMLMSNTTYVNASTVAFSEADVVATEATEEMSEEAVTEEVSEAEATEEMSEEAVTEEASETEATEEMSEEAVTEEASETETTEELSEEAVTEEASETEATEETSEEAETEEASETETTEAVPEETLVEAEAYEAVAEGDADILYSGTDAGITWQITTDGVLTISGKQTGDVAPEAKWLEHKDEIKKAVVTAKGMTSMAEWFKYCNQMVEADLSQADTSKVTDMFGLFQGCSKMTKADISGFDTSNVTNMGDMFYHCNSLEKLDVSTFDTSNVTAMSYMFNDCSSLEELDVSGFDTSKVKGTGMLYMFTGCRRLKKLDVSGFDTSKITNMREMFHDCRNLVKVDVSNFDTSNVTNMRGMFEYCSSLEELDVSGFNTSKVTDMRDMFFCCKNIDKLDVSGFDTSNVTLIEYMFYQCNNLKELDVSGFDISKVTDTGSMFSGCNSLKKLDVSGFNTSKVTDMSSMFSSCNGLEELDVSGFNTSKVTDMGFMFSGCNSLENLDVSGFNTSKVIRMDWMFADCNSLKDLDVSDFDTSKVTSMWRMFYGCKSLEELDVSGFDTSNVTMMDNMFAGCSGLEELDVSGFDTSNATNMTSMFQSCSSLVQLDVSGFDTSKVTGMSRMFSGCSSLAQLDLSGFDVSKVTHLQRMLSNCTSLTYLKTMPNVTEDIELPMTMYDDEYGAHTSIPKNKESMHLHTLCTVTFDSGDGTEPEKIENVLTMHTVETPTPVSADKKVFAGWFTEKNGKGQEFTDKTPVERDTYLYAHWTGGLWVEEVAPQTYTGKAIKPQIQVYNGDKLLKEKVDYTVSYKNNVKANDASNAAKAPTIIVQGKGNYSGRETITFQILRQNLQNETVSYADVLKVANNKVQKPVPTIQYNGKTLKNNTDFTVSYPDLNNSKKPDAYKVPGEYTILVKGKGNFEGELQIPFVITGAVLMSKTKIASIAAQPYTGKSIKPEVQVTYKGTTLEPGKDYTVEYKNNVNVGNATAIVTGIGNYAGTKEVTFKIAGISIAKATVKGVVNKVYSGQEQTQNIEVLLGGKKLDSANYTVTYLNNTNVGTASVVITGKDKYTGTVKKTFKITAKDISKDSQCKYSSGVEYTKGGALTQVTITVGGLKLEENKDYTVSYSNNKKVTKKGDTKLPTITIKGKGNYKGTVKKTYTITAKDLSSSKKPVTIHVPDVAYSAKAGKYISKPVLTDSDGKKLVAGTDYEKNVVYTLADGTVLNSRKDAPKAGTVIHVKVKGKGNYKGTIQASYKITKASFNAAKITVDAQTYTGEKIFLSESDLTVKIGKTELKYGKDFKIVEDSYQNNENKGTATVTVKGVGNYGGEKTVKFRIVSKEFSWFWSLF